MRRSREMEDLSAIIANKISTLPNHNCSKAVINHQEFCAVIIYIKFMSKHISSLLSNKLFFINTSV